MSLEMSEIKNNKIKLLSKIKKIHESSFYKNENLPKLIAVSKQQKDEKIIEALECGQKMFGENRIQEAEKRWDSILRKNQSIELHLIGPLQTNKVKKALNLFDVVHTLDRQSLAIEIAKNLKNEVKTKSFFIQVNTGKEPQKSGVFPEKLDDFYTFCTKKLNIPIVGLMCIPPVDETSSIHFCYLKNLSKKLKLHFLSMGMSTDYDEAIKFGATHLRVGTDFFGKRKI